MQTLSCRTSKTNTYSNNNSYSYNNNSNSKNNKQKQENKQDNTYNGLENKQQQMKHKMLQVCISNLYKMHKIKMNYKDDNAMNREQQKKMRN